MIADINLKKKPIFLKSEPSFIFNNISFYIQFVQGILDNTKISAIV